MKAAQPRGHIILRQLHKIHITCVLWPAHLLSLAFLLASSKCRSALVVQQLLELARFYRSLSKDKCSLSTLSRR